MCYFGIVADGLESGDAWALGPHRLVCGEDSDAAAFSAIDAAIRHGSWKGRQVERGALALRPCTRDGASGFPRPAHGANVHLFLHVKARENRLDDPERYRAMGLEFPKG